jgi:hypothetical protein
MAAKRSTKAPRASKDAPDTKARQRGRLELTVAPDERADMERLAEQLGVPLSAALPAAARAALLLLAGHTVDAQAVLHKVTPAPRGAKPAGAGGRWG